MKRCMFRSLLLESLSMRALMAADVVVAEDFNDGNANEFTSVYSSTQSAGVVDSHSSHGNVFQIDYTKDESQALLSESINARSIDVSYETRFLDSIPVSQVRSGFLGIKLSRLIVSDGDQTVASMQNELHAYAARTNGTNQDQFAFQTFIDTADKSDNPPLNGSTADWLAVRYYGLLNTPGKSDGVWIVWLNGKKVVEHRDVHWTDSPNAKFTTFWVGGNISLQGQDPATPIRRQIDNVRVVVDSPESPTLPSQPVDAVRVETIDGERVMLIDGTNNSDSLNVVVQNGQASVRLNGKQASFSGIDRVEVATLDGNDLMSIQSDVPVTILGGQGNDRMNLAGTGLYHASGEDGDDLMVASGSAAIVNGGAGRDSLYALGGKKLLIGGLGEDQLVSLSNRGPHVMIADNVEADSEAIDLVFESLAELSPMDGAIEQLLQVAADGNRDRLYDLGRTQAFSIAVDSNDAVYRRRR